MTSPLWEGVREGCGSCIYGKRHEWVQKSQPPVTHTYIECRRYPPTMVQGIEHNGHGNISYEVTQHSPTMQVDDWCGEWKRKMPE